ncbi:MAG: phosphatidate cytidylyltransferase [Bacteroidales bacterium]|nr:phosphatidate cytidylyltransferase [Bacteroidales bacterium]
MSNFWARTITGLSMVFVLLAAMAISYWLLAGLFFVITIFGLWEFYSLLTTETIRPQRIYGTIGGALLYLIITSMFWFELPVTTNNQPFIPVLIAIPLLFFPFVLEIYRKQPQPLINIAITITGFLYIALPLALLNLMNGEDVVRFWQFPVILAGFFILTWFYDTGAYLYGKQFGKHKFFERISPKKTWEGTIAGVIVALLTAVGLHYLAPEISLADWLAIALLIILFGTFGDLAESLFKRSLSIKDSGSILPGHGGILDRFDTILISVPFVFLYLVLRNLI